MERALGIDFGTTQCLMSVWEDGATRIIPNAEGFRATPSVVAYAQDRHLLVGQAARLQAGLNPQGTVLSVKRFLGRRWQEVDRSANITSCAVVAGPNAAIRFPLAGKLVSPEEITASLLRKLVDDASRSLGEEVREAAIAVPANFNHSQRQAVITAAELAGLRVLRLLNEPTAVALAYELRSRSNGTILVFDLGAGTFDVAILDVGEGVCEIRAVAGDTQLGGIDFDQRLVVWMADSFQKQHGIDLRSDPRNWPGLWQAAEQARIALSSNVETEIHLASSIAVQDSPGHLVQTLTRAKLEALTGDLIEKCRQALQQVVREARLSVHEIDEVLLVGGTARMPAIRAMVEEQCGKPCSGAFDAHEAVAMGAALQAAMVKGWMANVVVLDATPLPLSVGTPGGGYTRIIERNTTIPCRREEILTTAEQDQSSVDLMVLQGGCGADIPRALGHFRIEGLGAAPGGVPCVKVVFDMDANGILRLTAWDQSIGKQLPMTGVEATSQDQDEAERMFQEGQRSG
jgi:molecular chaperone DnaK